MGNILRLVEHFLPTYSLVFYIYSLATCTYGVILQCCVTNLMTIPLWCSQCLCEILLKGMMLTNLSLYLLPHCYSWCVCTLQCNTDYVTPHRASETV